VDGRESPSFQLAAAPSLSRDGRVVAHMVVRDDECFIRIGDREAGPFDEVTHPVVSQDGSTVAYAGVSDGRGFLIVGQKATPIGRKPLKVFISHDGREAGWIDRVDLPDGGCKMRVVAFGKPGEPFSIIGKPAFSPAQPLVAYAAEEEEAKYVVIGDKKLETPHRVGEAVFSPDGRKVGYGARIGRELWWKVIDVGSHR
jgi:hypothetical protein